MNVLPSLSFDRSIIGHLIGPISKNASCLFAVILLLGCDPGLPRENIAGIWVTDDYSRVLVFNEDQTYVYCSMDKNELTLPGFSYTSHAGRYISKSSGTISINKDSFNSTLQYVSNPQAGPKLLITGSSVSEDLTLSFSKLHPGKDRTLEAISMEEGSVFLQLSKSEPIEVKFIQQSSSNQSSYLLQSSDRPDLRLNIIVDEKGSPHLLFLNLSLSQAFLTRILISESQETTSISLSQPETNQPLDLPVVSQFLYSKSPGQTLLSEILTPSNPTTL